MAHTRVWEETTPVGTEDVSLGDDRIRNLKVDLGERLEDLLYGFNTSVGTGDEATPGIKVLNFKEQSSIATPSANQINIAAKVGADGDAKAQLWAKDEDGNERQLTKTSGSALRLNVKAGDYAADSIDEDDIRLGKNSYLKGLNNAGDDEVDLIKADANDKACLSDGAVLAAATEAGDGDRTISDKKYVDDQKATANQRCKAWVNFTGRVTNGACTLNGSFNVASVNRTGTGLYTIAWDTDFADANYVWVGSGHKNASSIFVRGDDLKAAGADQTASVAYIECTTHAGNSNDPDRCRVIAFGDQ